MHVDFNAVISAEDWKHYWSLCDAVIIDLQAAQTVAEELKTRIVAAVRS